MSNSPAGDLQLSPVKQALLAVKQLEARLAESARRQSEPLAVIGMACRFPGGADDAEAFWRLLRDGIDAISEVPRERWDPQAFFHPDPDAPGKMTSLWGGFVDGVDRFDAEFFGISPSEAQSMDPQQRLLLEVAWHALESAGQEIDRLAGSRTGVFVGLSNSDYLLLNGGDPHQIGAHFGTGVNASVAAGRLSYLLGLQGPSLTLDTACSSSLVAVHLACQSLRQRESDLALAAGVNVILAPAGGIYASKIRAAAADGRCKSFDAAADGYVRSEGCGVVLLKRLSDAQADGDPILALVRGSAVNQDGRSNGLTAPNGLAQQALLRQALKNAGVAPGRIAYVEAHGSGTPLGDPIEARALAAVLGEGRPPGSRVAIGSVKSNIGHLEAAAGVAGLIKTVLALRHREIPPSLHFATPNPEIPFESMCLRVQETLGPWPDGSGPATAGVSSFGFSGTNAHVVLEEAPQSEPSGPSQPWQMLVLSARTATALETMTENLARYLEREPETSLADVAFTCAGRKRFDHRCVLVCRDREDALRMLRSRDCARLLSGVEERVDRQVGFLFPGLGDQYPGMSRGLYEAEPTFRREVDLCCELLQPRLGVDLRQLLYPEGIGTSGHPGGPELDLRRMLGRRSADHASPGALARTLFAQPAVFVVELALARLWMEWGIRPGALLGYSLGEYVAACLAGVMSLDDALVLVAERARLLDGLPAGAMLAVPLPAEALASRLAAGVSLAAVNGPALCVAAGPAEAVAALADRLQAEGVTTARLATTHAFHSSMMEPVAERLAELLRSIALQPPSIPYLSNLTGTWITPEQAMDPGYWVAHTLGTVRFAEGLEELARESGRILLEVGPGASLTAFAKQHPAFSGERARLAVASLRADYDRQPDEAVLLTALGRLWLAGVEVDWPGFHAHGRRRKVALPTYPFERRRHWLPLPGQEAGAARSFSELPKRPDLASWLYVPSWSRRPLSPQQEKTGPWLVLAERSGPGARIAERLRESGWHVTWAAPGPGFAVLGNDDYEIDPRRREDYEALLAHLGARGRLPVRVIHLWTVTQDDREPCLDGLEASRTLGFGSLLLLAQALARTPEPGVEIVVVTNDLYEVTGEERVRPEKALVAGPVKVIPQEIPGLRCRLVDLSIPEEESEGERDLFEGLAAELSATSEDQVVALRRRHRWVQTFAPRPLPESVPGTRLRPQGVYLITGGLGGIGLALAEHLARSVRAKLVLTGRTALPPRDTWDSIVAAADGSDAARRIRAILAIEALGGEVLAIAAEVTDLEAMRRTIEQAVVRFGALHGVVHAAGVPGGGLVQLKEPAAAAAVLAPKTLGTLVLDEVCRGLDLDFLVLFSSLVASTGGVGQVDYGSANAFLEAFAQRCHGHHGTTIAVAWGEWEWNAWEGNLDLNTKAAVRERRARAGIGFAEGAEIFQRILAHPSPQVIVSPQDLSALLAFSAQAFVTEATRGPEPVLHPRPVLGTPYVAPRGPLEEKVAEIWQAALGLAQVGARDDFFDLGGTSLHATQVISRVRQEFGAELTARNLFDAAVLADFAACIAAAGKEDGAPSLVPVGRGGPLPVSFAQRRLWFLDQLEPGDPAYTVAFFRSISGRLDVAAWCRALSAIVERHEILRTTFQAIDGEPVQVIGPPVPLPAPVCDLSGLPGARREAETQRLASAAAVRPFDLERDLMVRLTLVRLAETEHAALFTLHHIAGDGWSAAVMMNELACFYEAFAGGTAPALPALAVQYADFAVWQRGWLQGEVLESKLAYWRRRLAGAPPQLALPFDRPRAGVPARRGGRQAFRLPADLTGELQRLGRREGATLFMTLLAAFGALLQRTCGASDLVVGTEVANRDRVEIENLIGFFVNIVPLRFEVSGSASFQALLGEVRETVLSAFAHQDLPFDKLVEDLAPERSRSRVPLAQTMLVLQHAAGNLRTPAGLTLAPFPVDLATTKFDLLLTFEEDAEGLAGEWHYGNDLFEKASLQQMSRRFTALLGAIVARPEARLRDLEVTSLSERERKSMEPPQGRESKLKSFLSVRPKAISVSQDDLVRTRHLAEARKLPLVVEPAVAAFDLVEWAKSNRSWIERELLVHGALLFRGANVRSAEEFERFASGLCGELFAEYGDLPREDLGGKVYTSTPYPPDQAILFHNESSQLHAWPLKQLFLCLQPAERGGETPIADCRQVYQLLDAGLRRRFEERGLLYVRNFVPEIDVHWAEFFRTQDRAEVEEQCQRAGMTCEWYDGSLRTAIRCRAVAKHPKTGEMVFFNQIQAHHVSCLEPAVRDSLRNLFSEDRLPRNVYYGDGSPIEDSVVAEVRAVYDEVAVSFPWQRGDVLVVDNMLTAHSRRPYAGPRKIVVTMGEMVANADLDPAGWPATMERVALTS